MSAPMLWLGARQDLRLTGNVVKRDQWVSITDAVELLSEAERANAEAAATRAHALRSASEAGYAEGLEQGRLEDAEEMYQESPSLDLRLHEMTSALGSHHRCESFIEQGKDIVSKEFVAKVC